MPLDLREEPPAAAARIPPGVAPRRQAPPERRPRRRRLLVRPGARSPRGCAACRRSSTSRTPSPASRTGSLAKFVKAVARRLRRRRAAPEAQRRDRHRQPDSRTSSSTPPPRNPATVQPPPRLRRLPGLARPQRRDDRRAALPGAPEGPARDRSSDRPERAREGAARRTRLRVRRTRASSPYLDPIVDEIAAADLVVCRAGAMTIGELAAVGRAAILVPFAAATNNHQELNARVVEQRRRRRRHHRSGADAGAARPRPIADIVSDPERAAGWARRRSRWPPPKQQKESSIPSRKSFKIQRDKIRMNFDHIRTIHFVGIGGIGMSGIAEILAESGLSVVGMRPQALRGHRPARAAAASPSPSATIPRTSTASISSSSPPPSRARTTELDAARAPRHSGSCAARRCSARSSRSKRAVGVSGTHGKTTTSAMIATVLDEAGLDPTRARRRHGPQLRRRTRRAGSGDFLVVEADEYDRTFHQLHPEIAVVTNIEADHLEYYGSFEAIVEAFRIFADGISRAAWSIGCVDDPAVADAARVARGRRQRARVVRYGTLRERRHSRHEPRVRRARLVVRSARARLLQAVRAGRAQRAQRAGGDRRRARARRRAATPSPPALAKFLGVDRRFQILGDYGGAIIVDDYAHHPTEIRATLDAARRGYPDRRVVALFQPHLYSRTRDFAREFASALRIADVAIVAPIYAAREKPIEGVSRADDRRRGERASSSSTAATARSSTSCAGGSSRTTSSSPWAPATCTRSPRCSCGERA